MIRVAYDVTAAVSYPRVPTPATGVARVIREVLFRLAENNEFQVNVVGSYGGDWNPVSTSLRAQWWAAQGAARPLRSSPAFRSHTGLARMLGLAQLRWEAACERKNRKLGSQSHPFPLRLLRRVLKADAKPDFPDGLPDIFFATFLPPPAFLLPNIPRAVLLYDVIPARIPEECGPVVCEMLKNVISSLNPDRDVVVAISEFTKSDFCTLTGFPDVRVFVAPLAADHTFYPATDAAVITQVRKRYGLGSQPYFLSVSNPQPRKNLARTIRAFFKTAKALPQWTGNLALAGDDRLGWGAGELSRVIDEDPTLAARVLRTGPVAEEDLAPLYSGCECFLFPSTYEGFGLPALEAMQCGAPVICSNTTSLPELAGDSALLVDPLSETGIATAMMSVVQEFGLRSALSVRARNRARNFSWEHTAACVADAFRFATRPLTLG